MPFRPRLAKIESITKPRFRVPDILGCPDFCPKSHDDLFAAATGQALLPSLHYIATEPASRTRTLTRRGHRVHSTATPTGRPDSTRAPRKRRGEKTDTGTLVSRSISLVAWPFQKGVEKIPEDLLWRASSPRYQMASRSLHSLAVGLLPIVDKIVLTSFGLSPEGTKAS